MLLVIDVGNTNPVLGLFDEDKLLHSWRIRPVVDHTSDEYGIADLHLYKTSRVSSRSVKDIVISCVVPPMLNILEPMCE
jgi:type III pantothenate kinase